jgi:4-aminobutyrate aminotransferase-like enzyme
LAPEAHAKSSPMNTLTTTESPCTTPAGGADNAAIDVRRGAATPRGAGTGFNACARRAQNAEIGAVKGQRCTDFGAAIAVPNTGHGHPHRVKAMAVQLERPTHTAYLELLCESTVTPAKSWAGGMALSPLCGRAEIKSAPVPGGLGGTCAVNPLAVMDMIEDEKLCARTAQRGPKLGPRPKAMPRREPAISDVRGLGTKVAMACAQPDATPDPDVTRLGQKKSRDTSRFALADLRCVRQRDPLSVAADHRRRGVQPGPGHSRTSLDHLNPTPTPTPTQTLL